MIGGLLILNAIYYTDGEMRIFSGGFGIAVLTSI
jgi:hypothetical protein